MRKLFLSLLCAFALFAEGQNQVNFTFTANASGNVVTFNNTSVLAADSFPKRAIWSFGDGTSQVTPPLAGVQHYYPSAAATYQACLRIYRYNTPNFSDSTLLGQICKTVIVQERCEAGFTAIDTVISGNHLVNFYWGSFNNANKPITQVCWNWGDGSDTCISVVPGTTPGSTIVHHYAQAGVYNVCLKVKFDGGCVAEKCQSVSVGNPAPADSCAAAFTTQPITANPLGRRFVAQPWHSNGKKPVRICWNLGNGFDTCVQYATNYAGDYALSYQYAVAGNYTVCVRIKYDGGCEKQSCQPLTVQAPTNCGFDLVEVAAAAAQIERRFYVSLPASPTAEKVCWSFGDGTDTCVLLSTPFNPQQLQIAHRYPAPGAYTVCAKVYFANGCIAERCRPVSINMANTNLCGGYMADSLVNPTTVRFKATGFTAATDNVLSYTWNFGDGTGATGQSATHTYAGAGRYSACVVMRTAAGCETRVCKPVIIAGNALPQLVLTPNPVTTVLNATFVSAYAQAVTVKIYNANGIQLRSYTRTAVIGTNNWVFADVATLPTGVYSMIVQSANQFATAIFFKQ